MKENHLYEAEIPLTEILEKMKKNTYYNFHNYSNSSINKDYLNLRTSIFKILQKLTMKMGFKSQTYFLSTYYLDIIFMKKKKININLFKIGLASFCISAKFCENDPNVPQLQYFIRIFNNIMEYKNIISMSDLMYSEVLICKLLNYKLNYYTIYDFNSFFFCHGILKLEQIKDIENDFKKKINDNKKNKIININTLFVKNILGKIYNISRNYLDIVIKLYKICMKYSPLYITILIVEKSIMEVLKNEYDKNCCKDNNNNYIGEKEEFCKKNYLYFKEVMNDFYKIDYESSEQYKQLLIDNEIQNIFKDNKKNNEKKNKEEKNTQIKINEENDDKNKLFNSSVSNGFYKRLKIPINNDLDNNQNIRNTLILKKVNNTNNEIPHEDLDSNLNINEVRDSQIVKYDKINNIKKINKIPIPKINSYNNNILDNNNNESIKIKIKKESNSNSPYKFKKIKSNKLLNFKKNNKNKKQKFKSLNETINNTFDNKVKIEINKNINKKPYLKKLITLNNKEIYNNNISNKIKASTATHFYSSKKNQISKNNTQNGISYLNSTKFVTSENNKDKIEKNDKINNSYISSFYKKENFEKKNKNRKLINTSIGERYRKKIKNNLIKIINNDIYTEIKNDINVNENKNIKIDAYKDDEKIKYITGDNFYPNKIKIKKISVNTTKESDMKNININKELKTKKLSLILSKKNSELNNTIKEMNKNIIEDYNKKGCITSRNNGKENEINLDIIKKNDKTNKYKKLDINNIKYNKNKNISNKNLSINVNKNNKIIKKNKNNSINISNNKKIEQRFSFRNKYNNNKDSINNINDGSLTSRENKNKINEKTQDKFQSSIYQIIKKTKNLFTKNKEEKEEDLISETKKLPNNNFYKSQQNFYKAKKDNTNNNKGKNEKNKNEEKNEQNSYAKNVINKISINNQKSNYYPNKKNSSTIIINNNINININSKAKNIKIPHLNLSNAILNTKTNFNLNNKYNTQRTNDNFNNNKGNNNNNPSTTRKTINNIMHKLPFNKKLVNKIKK